MENDGSVIDKYFLTPMSLIKTLIKSKTIHSMIWEGPPGSGKTYTTVETLKKLRTEFCVIAGYVTALSLHKLLFRHKENSVVVVDDVDSVFENNFCKGLLLAALSTTTKRTMNYLSSTPKLEDVPQEYDFESKIIFLVNEFPRELKNIKSRSFFYKTNFSPEEREQVLMEIGRINKIPHEVTQFVVENSSQIDLRLPLKIHDLYLHNKNWQELALQVMEVNDTLYRALKIMKSTEPVSEQVEEFQKVGLGSRRTYFNWKNKYLDGNAKVQTK